MAENVTKPTAVPKVKKIAKSKMRKIGIDLSEAVTNEVNDYCAKHKLVNRAILVDAIRTRARDAAEFAVSGKIEDVVRTLVGG